MFLKKILSKFQIYGFLLVSIEKRCLSRCIFLNFLRIYFRFIQTQDVYVVLCRNIFIYFEYFCNLKRTNMNQIGKHEPYLVPT